MQREPHLYSAQVQIRVAALAEVKGNALGSFHSCSHCIIFLFHPVSFKNLHSLFIDFIVIMALQVLNLFQAFRFVNHLRIHIPFTRGTQILVSLSNFENVLKTLQANCNNSWVWAKEKVTQWLDAALGDQIPI